MTATAQNLPFETDTRLAALDGQVSILRARIESSADYLRGVVLGEKKVWAGRRQVWAERRTSQWVLERVTARGEGQHRLAVKLRNDLSALDVAFAETVVLNKVFTDAGGWSRFFLVTSSDGHIHSSTGCSTCRITTEFGWHPELSGMTEADAVAKLGPTLCSVCFPTAPVAWTRSAAEVKAEADKAAGTYCEAATNDYSDASKPRYGRTGYATCNGCGHRASLTSRGYMRKHKPARAGK